MNQNNELPEDEKFSDDPDEDLRMQNDFLRMKMMAESGALFGGNSSLPAEIENQFLKNIIEFEKASANVKPVKLFRLLKNPHFEDQKDLSDEKFEVEFLRLESLLKDHQIVVHFKRERSARFQYDFITKELFEAQTSNISIEGMTQNFTYEEFHPDHEMDITGITENFLNDFLERNFSGDKYYMNQQIIEPDGNILSMEQLSSRINALYEVAVEFENCSYNIDKVDFELKGTDKSQTGMGFSEGTISYDLIFENEQRKEVRGPFKIYLSREWDFWGICFFYLAGYNLHRKE